MRSHAKNDDLCKNQHYVHLSLRLTDSKLTITFKNYEIIQVT